jgi:RNA polymerase sigma-70 factor (ECF subfamily)
LDPEANKFDNQPESDDIKINKEFVRLLTSHQHRIYAFILTLIPDWAIAEDILQDTSEVMWTKYAGVRPIENFSAWAMRIAYNKVLNYLSKKDKRSIYFDTELIADIAQRAQSVSDQMDERLEALRYCVGRLSETDRLLIRQRYEKNKTIKQIACELGRPIQGMYKRMMRIHERLLRCIRHRLVLET